MGLNATTLRARSYFSGLANILRKTMEMEESEGDGRGCTLVSIRSDVAAKRKRAGDFSVLVPYAFFHRPRQRLVAGTWFSVQLALGVFLRSERFR